MSDSSSDSETEQKQQHVIKPSKGKATSDSANWPLLLKVSYKNGLV